jgi:hypothetical protein
MSGHTAHYMRWHVEGRTRDGVLRHPADGEAWRSFDILHPDFMADSRNMRLGLIADGFNPFGNMTSRLCRSKLSFQYGNLKKILFFFHTTSSELRAPIFRFFLPAPLSPNAIPSNCWRIPSNCWRISSPNGTSGAHSNSSVPSNVLLFSRHSWQVSLVSYITKFLSVLQTFRTCRMHTARTCLHTSVRPTE